MTMAVVSKHDELADVRQCWRTPEDLFNELNAAFGFTVDAAASSENALLMNFWDKEDDGTKQSWRGQIVFCNPPFGKTRDFLAKGKEATTAVFLVPLMSVATEYGYVSPPDYIAIPRKRVQYRPPAGTELGASSPFPSALLFYGNVRDSQRQAVEKLGYRWFRFWEG